jgi:F-type H+-transporting ATPase subunit b
MLLTQFAAESAEKATGVAALGVNAQQLLIQFITFVLVFVLLIRFAFRPIIKMLEKRRVTIEDGVKLGLEMEEERDNVKKDSAKIIRDARHDADRIIANSNKEAREIIREAEKTAQRKSESILHDAEARIAEETVQARQKLENDIVNLVSEATEVVVKEKIDPKKDASLINEVIRRRLKK